MHIELDVMELIFLLFFSYLFKWLFRGLFMLMIIKVLGTIKKKGVEEIENIKTAFKGNKEE